MEGREEMEGAEETVSLEFIFGNHLILQNIISQMEVSELRKARLLNTMWNHYATKTLRSRDRQLRISAFADLENGTLDRLFPSTALEINMASSCSWDFGDLDAAEHATTTSLVKCPSTLKSLSRRIGKMCDTVRVVLLLKSRQRVEDSMLPMPSQILESILNNSLKMVTLELSLALDEFQVEKNGVGYYYLPSLRKVKLSLRHFTRVEPYNSVCKSLIEGAPNLEVIEGAVLGVLAGIMECNKLSCVKSLHIDSSFISTSRDLFDMYGDARLQAAIGLFQLYMTSGLNPESLILSPVSIPLHWSVRRMEKLELHAVLAELLLGNRKTLRRIETTQLDFIDTAFLLETPVFENLEYLKIDNREGICSCLLPRQWGVEVLFPRLQEVRLTLQALTSGYPDVYFRCDPLQKGSHPTFLTVRKLSLDCVYDSQGIRILSAIFPNVKDFTYYQLIGRYIHSFQGGMWDLPESVESVTLHFEANDLWKRIENLDEILTGIPQSTLDKLQGQPTIDRLWDSISSQNGIRKLKALKRLNIIFDLKESQLHHQFFHHYYEIPKRRIMKMLKRPFFVKKGSFTKMSCLYALQSGGFKTYISYDGRSPFANQIQKMISVLGQHVIPKPCYSSETLKEFKDLWLCKVRDCGLFDPCSYSDDPYLHFSPDGGTRPFMPYYVCQTHHLSMRGVED